MGEKSRAEATDEGTDFELTEASQRKHERIEELRRQIREQGEKRDLLERKEELERMNDEEFEAWEKENPYH